VCLNLNRFVVPRAPAPRSSGAGDQPAWVRRGGRSRPVVFVSSGPGRRATARGQAQGFSSGRGRSSLRRRRERSFARPRLPSSRSLPTLSPDERMHRPRLARIATRNLPRSQLGLTPALNRTIAANERAKPHPAPFERPHCSVRRLAYPPLAARSKERHAHRTLRGTASPTP
jgi:hypothetical protein